MWLHTLKRIDGFNFTMTAQADFREFSPVSQASALWGVADVQSSDFGDNQMTAHGRKHVSSSYLEAVTRGKGNLLGLHRVRSERPRVAGRYSGCYVRTTVSGDSSDHTLASDAHLHTCFAGTRGVIILLHSHQDGANVRASRPSFLSCCRVPHWLEESSWGTGPFLASCRTSTASGHRPQAGIVIPRNSVIQTTGSDIPATWTSNRSDAPHDEH